MASLTESHPSFKSAMQFILSIALLGLLFYFVDPRSIATALVQADSTRVFLAFALLPLSVLMSVIIWWILLKLIDEETTLRSAAIAVMMGFSLAAITPARVGELGGRVYYHRALGKGRLVGAFALQGVYRSTMYFLGGAAAILYAMQSDILDPATWSALVLAALLATVMCVAAGIMPRAVVLSLSRFKFLSRALKTLDFADRLSRRTSLLLFTLTFLRYATTILQFTLLLGATGVQVPTSTLMAGAGFVFFIKSFIPNLFFTDLGIREGAAVYFFSTLGSFGPQAVAAALGLFGLNALLPAIVGIPAFWMKQRSG